MIGWPQDARAGILPHAAAQTWIEQNRELAQTLFAVFQQMNGQAAEDQAYAQIDGPPHDDGHDQQDDAENSVAARMEPGVDDRSPATLDEVLSAAARQAHASIDAHLRRGQLRQRDDKSDASHGPDLDADPHIDFEPVDDDFADFMSSDSRHAVINKLLDQNDHPPEFFSTVIAKLKDSQVELPTIIKDLNTCAALKLAGTPSAATVANYVKACAAVSNWLVASPESDDYAALFRQEVSRAAALHGMHNVAGECIRHLAASMAKATPTQPDATRNEDADVRASVAALFTGPLPNQSEVAGFCAKVWSTLSTAMYAETIEGGVAALAQKVGTTPLANHFSRAVHISRTDVAASAETPMMSQRFDITIEAIIDALKQGNNLSPQALKAFVQPLLVNLMNSKVRLRVASRSFELLGKALGGTGTEAGRALNVKNVHGLIHDAFQKAPRGQQLLTSFDLGLASSGAPASKDLKST